MKRTSSLLVATTLATAALAGACGSDGAQLTIGNPPDDDLASATAAGDVVVAADEPRAKL